MFSEVLKPNNNIIENIAFRLYPDRYVDAKYINKSLWKVNSFKNKTSVDEIKKASFDTELYKSYNKIKQKKTKKPI